MKSILIAMTLASAVAVAETGTFTVKGMHCGGCKASVTKKVCEGEAAKDAESCTVNLTDAKKEIGEVVIVTKPGVKINEEAVSAGVKAAGDYSVTEVKIKEMIAKDIKADSNSAAAATGATPDTETTTTTVETNSHDHHGKPVVKVEKTKKIIKKMTKKDGAATATTTAPAAAATPAATAPSAPTTPETK